MLSAREKNLEIVTRFVELRRDYQLARVQLLSLLGR